MTGDRTLAVVAIAPLALGSGSQTFEDERNVVESSPMAAIPTKRRIDTPPTARVYSA